MNSGSWPSSLSTPLTSPETSSLAVACHLATQATDRVLGHGTALCSVVSQYLHNEESSPSNSKRLTQLELACNRRNFPGLPSIILGRRMANGYSTLCSIIDFFFSPLQQIALVVSQTLLPRCGQCGSRIGVLALTLGMKCSRTWPILPGAI